jgi:hypothetical protein
VGVGVLVFDGVTDGVGVALSVNVVEGDGVPVLDGVLDGVGVLEAVGVGVGVKQDPSGSVHVVPESVPPKGHVYTGNDAVDKVQVDPDSDPPLGQV